MTFGENQEFIVNLLLKRKILTPAAVESAKKNALKRNTGPVDYMVESGLLSEEAILMEMAESLGMDFITISKQMIDPKAVEKITPQQARDFGIMPYKMEFNTLIVATSRPHDLHHLDTLRHILNTNLDCVVSSSKDIKAAIDSTYNKIDPVQAAAVMKESGVHASQSPGSDVEQALMNFMDSKDEKNLSADDAPVIRLVSGMIHEAFRLRASDIHLEPMEKYYRVRYRIDGVLVEIKRHPKQLQNPISSRVKLLADMKLSERRLPQDGKIKINLKNKAIDIRVSTLPGTWGESIVMRILDKSSLKLGLPNLGFLSDTEKIWDSLIQLSNGVILITGPTGSGKTTTLYSCLNALNVPGRKIITVEDPIEYQLSGINQVQVREEIDLTFSSVLRACLRQAPNIIMVGEIRDSETARIAMNAAFTGHLVFSTLHTNDAPGAITRLIDQGIEPFLVASAVRGILAQRLVRKICPECKTPYKATQREMDVLNLSSEKVPQLYKGTGCVNCNNSGYKGRCGIFELMTMNPNIQELVFSKRSSAEIRQMAIQNGMRTLREDGVIKVLNGTTTIEELLRVTKIGET